MERFSSSIGRETHSGRPKRMSETERSFRELQKPGEQQRAERAARRNARKATVVSELNKALKSLDEAEASQIRAQQRERWRKERLAKRNALQADIEKFGQAKKPLVRKGLKKPEWDGVLKTFLAKDPGRTKALFLDFDGTMARFTETPEETQAVRGFFSAVETLVDKGYKVAIITGRPIDGDKGILKALKRSGAPPKLIDRLDIFGSHGIQHRGRETHWKVQVPQGIAEMIEPYKEPQKQLLDHIQQRINANNTLKDSGISIEAKVSGATIHYKGVAENSRESVKNALNELLSQIMPLASDNQNFGNMESQTYKGFTYNSATESYEIRLNPVETDITLNKGTAVETLVERWEVKDAIAFGDDRTDLHMQAQLQKLSQSDELESQAFVGVNHSKTPQEIIDNSTIVVEGQESAVGLLVQMAKQAEDQKSKP